LYLIFSLILSFLLDESRSHDDVHKFFAMHSDEKCSQLASFRLEKFGFIDCKTNPCLVLNKSRLSLPVDLLAADIEEGLAVEEAGDVLQVKDLVRFRAGKFDLSCPMLLVVLKRSSNDCAGFAFFMNGKVKSFIDLAIVLDFLSIVSILLSGCGIVRLSLRPCRYDSRSGLGQLPDKCRKQYPHEGSLVCVRFAFSQFDRLEKDLLGFCRTHRPATYRA
jgi:hypothetical protein